MRAEIVLVTKEMAEDMLTRNPNYRKLSPHRVSQYARKMELGLWKENGEGIQIDTNNNLKNGQHRLSAIVKCGIPQKMLIVYDVEPSVNVYDAGQSRSKAQYMRAEYGKTVHSGVVAAIGTILSKGTSSANYLYGPEEIGRYYSEHQSTLEQALSLAIKPSATGSLMQKAGCVVAIYCCLRFTLLSETELEAFCKMVNTGFPADDYSCIAPLALRKTLLDPALLGQHRGYLYITAVCDVTIQAMQAFKRKSENKRMLKPKCITIPLLNKLYELDHSERANNA